MKAVAQVKGILQAYIARIEYDPDTRKARVGFYRGPFFFFPGPVPPGGGGPGKPQNSGVSTLAGGGFDTKNACLDWEMIDLVQHSNA